jgi:transposase InsO family protein
VPPEQIQEQFRKWFERWGLPEEVRLDNGCPWGGRYDLPTVFALWLMGLGLGVRFNPARQPQQNGVIERFNGLGQRWAELDKCSSVAEAQAHLDGADEIQREYMPSVGGQSRLQAYEGLKHSGRRYSRQAEEENWNLDKAEEVLETYRGKRKVGSQGRISMYYRQVYVAQREAGVEVLVQYDKASKMWLISTEAGKVLRMVPAIEISREKIMTLTMYEEAKEKRRGVAN